MTTQEAVPRTWSPCPRHGFLGCHDHHCLLHMWLWALAWASDLVQKVDVDRWALWPHSIQIQNFNTQIQKKKAHQTWTKGSNVNNQFHIKFTNLLFIHQWINLSGFYNFGVNLVFTNKIRNKNRFDLKLNLQNQIRSEREIIQGDPDLIGEIAHRVFRQIQKILNPTKHNNLVVGWNSNEGLTRKEIGLVELS